MHHSLEINFNGSISFLYMDRLVRASACRMNRSIIANVYDVAMSKGFSHGLGFIKSLVVLQTTVDTHIIVQPAHGSEWGQRQYSLHFCELSST